MKKHLVLLSFSFFLFLSSLQVSAQVAVNADGSAPDASAMLDVKSTVSGVLITRMTQAERNAIVSPATGLIVYQTNILPDFYFYNGSEWKRIGQNNHYIGELYGGGIIFWVDLSGQHGLIASLVDILPPPTTAWSPGPILTPANSSWNGQFNSSATGLSCLPVNYCNLYVNASYGTGVYGDWYLPSMKELSLLYQASYIINKTVETSPPGWNIMSNQFYWSSTDIDINNAWGLNFGTGLSASTLKTIPGMVRAVRLF